MIERLLNSPLLILSFLICAELVVALQVSVDLSTGEHLHAIMGVLLMYPIAYLFVWHIKELKQRTKTQLPQKNSPIEDGDDLGLTRLFKGDAE